MRPRFHLIVAVTAMLAAGPATSGGTPPRVPDRLNQPISRPLDQKLFDEAVLIYSNAVREQHGRAPLARDPALSRAASDHARNMARLKTHSHDLPVRGQANLRDRIRRQSVTYRNAAENIAMDKVYRLLGRPISIRHDGCRFTYDDTGGQVPVHTYASLAKEVVSRWLASPKHRASLLSRKYARLGSGVGLDPDGAACGDLYLVQDFAD